MVEGEKVEKNEGTTIEDGNGGEELMVVYRIGEKNCGEGSREGKKTTK